MKIKKSDNLETLTKGLAVLRLFSRDITELSIPDAAECLNLSRAAARRFLMTLENLGYLERSGRSFRITPEVLKLGYSYYTSQDLIAVVRPILQRLVDELGEACGLAVLHRDDIVYLGGLPGKQIYPTTLSAGTFLPAYPTAAGRVLLGGLPREQFEEYLRRVKLTRFTPYTIGSVEELRLAVEKTRKSGYSVVANELAYGTVGMAAPIFDGQQSMRAAMYIGLQHGQNTKAMTTKYLPHLKAAAGQVSDILAKTTGLPG